MQVVTRFSDRVKAIGSVLTVNTPVDDRLVVWAMSQLADMRSSAADAELTRFSAEIKGLTMGSSEQQRFVNLKQHVEAYLERIDQRKRSSPGLRGIVKPSQLKSQ